MKTNKIYITITAIFTLLLFACSEDKLGENETGTITGTVVEQGSNTPVPNAKISTQPVSNTVFTNNLGEFILENVPTGQYSVQAQKDSFNVAFEPVIVVASAAVNVVFELTATVGNNRPPFAPVLVAPAENEIVASTSTTFIWTAEDPDENDLTFNLELRNDQNTNIERFENIADTTFTYSSLILGAKYFWQVGADDGVSEPTLSAIGTFTVVTPPVGNRFLFTRTINGNNVIFSSDEDGNEFQLTPSNKNSFRPIRNVAANRIAFFQTNGAQLDIFTMSRDGTDVQQVTSNIRPSGFNLNEISFSWPAGSNRIYFPSQDKLYRINTNGQDLNIVYITPDGSLVSEVDVNITEEVIAIKTNNLDGYNVNIFTTNLEGVVQDIVFTGQTGAVSGLNLSFTGLKVLYSYDITGIENIQYRREDSRIMLYDIPSGAPALELSGLKDPGTNDLYPSFSPTDARVIFTNTPNDDISQRNVIQIEIGNNQLRTLLFENAFFPNWE